jgi:hypothetical protein
MAEPILYMPLRYAKGLFLFLFIFCLICPQNVRSVRKMSAASAGCPQNVRTMSEYITTQQAAALLNTTDRTIRRKLAKMSVECPQLSAYVRREQGTILIDIRLVRGNFERMEDEPQPEAQEPKQENSTTDIVNLLTGQLAVKDSQIKELQERNRELTYLLGVEQKDRKLLLSSPIPQPLNDLNNTEKLSNNSDKTVINANLQWIILFALAIIIIMLILLYTDAVL